MQPTAPFVSFVKGCPDSANMFRKSRWTRGRRPEATCSLAQRQRREGRSGCSSSTRDESTAARFAASSPSWRRSATESEMHRHDLSNSQPAPASSALGRPHTDEGHGYIRATARHRNSQVRPTTLVCTIPGTDSDEPRGPEDSRTGRGTSIYTTSRSHPTTDASTAVPWLPTAAARYARYASSTAAPRLLSCATSTAAGRSCSPITRTASSAGHGYGPEDDRHSASDRKITNYGFARSNGCTIKAFC